MKRDGILLREFLVATRDGFENIATAYDLAINSSLPSEWAGFFNSLPSEWAGFFFLLREVPDTPEFFPSGKWATIQALEEKLTEWAKGVIG